MSYSRCLSPGPECTVKRPLSNLCVSSALTCPREAAKPFPHGRASAQSETSSLLSVPLTTTEAHTPSGFREILLCRPRNAFC